ncbi:hypothetical protein ACIBCT_37990 [Streptosporangium sp. NPDC050855]|uniref:hypothetical protein n=1 Tax=Streptosporangium sp. NPDC050855 TaxID=3366194 RepID=UPI0037B148B1
MKLLAAIAATMVLGSSPAAAEPEESDREIPLAHIEYTTGLTVSFSDSQPSNEVGMSQLGIIGGAPLIDWERSNSYLQTYLEITPPDVPVPQRLVDDHGTDLPAELRGRRITSEPVTVRGLTAPADAVLSASCTAEHWGWHQWHDNAQAGLAPKSYTTHDFGGFKERRAESFIFNCLPLGSPSHLWARHRLYYWNGTSWWKHAEVKVAPGLQSEKVKGSLIKRHRRVTYDDGWGSSPNCLMGTCKYTREGRFTS